MTKSSLVEAGELLTAEQAAKLLGRSPWWVQEQCRRGKLPHKKVGRTRYFTEASLRDWLATVSVAG